MNFVQKINSKTKMRSKNNIYMRTLRTLLTTLLVLLVLPVAAQAKEAQQSEIPAMTEKKTSGPSVGWYAVTRHLHIGIYTGITWLSGDPLDGTPERLHKANYIWESGLKLGWRFGKQGKEASK